ncbi:MAG: ROK family transcriptional regulator [Promicromonosporaceae bacterium]|nr:ROK family transcriptional regulator [Promicromonosporaceae bacterium]
MPRRPQGTGSQTALRGLNTAAITRQLAVRGPQLQADLARRTGLSPATVSNIVNHEVAGGRIRTERVLRDGRWGVLVSVVPDDTVVVGIDVGRSHLRLVGSDTARRTFGAREVALELGHQPEETFALASRLLDELVENEGLSRSQVRRCGVALPASLGPDGAVVQQSVLREWAGHDLVTMARDALGIDVVVDNDANLGAFAHAGTFDVAGTLVYVKVASGIGAGIVSGNRVYRSTSGLSGELGHVQVVDGGQTCYCGSRGCLETLASTRTIIADYARVHARPSTLADVIEAVENQDPVALRILAEAGDALGRVLAVVCNLLSPDVVVVGGPLAPVGQPLLDGMEASLRKRALPAAISGTTFVVSDFEPHAEVVGACLLALQDVSDARPLVTTK